MDKSRNLLSTECDEIKKIDEQLISLFLKRMKYIDSAENLKESSGLPKLYKKREREVLETVQQEAGNYSGAAAAFYSSVIAMSGTRRECKCGDEIRKLVVKSPKSLNAEGKKILCQGVSGAYSHKAVKTFFGKNANISFKPTWNEVFESIEHGDADFGVVPVENSAAGSVSEVYGLIMKYRYFICGAVNVSVEHCLAKRKGEKITGVVSHPQALLQCSGYIKKKGYKQANYSNTAAAAKYISENRKPGFGAICSKEAALKYGLEIEDESIQDSRNNHTRFAVIGREAILPENAGKISLCFSIPNITGSLYCVLERFAQNGLNLSKIESRPISGSDFEYDFYLDFLGNIHSENVLNLICSLHDELPRFSFLGNYNEI